MIKLKNKLSNAFYIVLVAFLFTGCSRVKLYQETSTASVCENTVYISTYVRTYNWYGFPNTLEYGGFKKVKKELLDSVKNSEYKKAKPIYNKVLNCY